jgi:hypothetical protein
MIAPPHASPDSMAGWQKQAAWCMEHHRQQLGRGTSSVGPQQLQRVSVGAPRVMSCAAAWPCWVPVHQQGAPIAFVGGQLCQRPPKRCVAALAPCCIPP